VGVLAGRRRVRLGLAGIAMMILGLVCWPLADASRFGVAHALPTIVLVEWLRVSPGSHGAVACELQSRVDSQRLWACERRELAGVCAEIMRRETDGAVRRDVAWLLSRLGADTPPEAIGRMLGDRDAAVRALGIEATRRSNLVDEAARGALPGMVLRDRSALVRRRAIDAMRAMGDMGVGEPGEGKRRSTILLALEDPNDGVRQSAISALGDSADRCDETLLAVCGKAADPSENVRWSAAIALGRIREARPEALAALAGSLEDQSPMVRASAASALGQLGGSASPAVRGWMLPRLLGSALGDSDDMVRSVAMEAFRGVLGWLRP
jgi:HEAT repeat protein